MIFSRSASCGFTLLEVLVALAIIGLGMAAVFTQMNQSVTATSRLRDKTLAAWIAMDRITELRVSSEFPEVGDRSDDLKMANTEWRYTIKTSQTNVPEIRRVEVSVAFDDSPDNVLATITGFLNRPAATTAQQGGLASGWPIPNTDQSQGITR